MRGRNYLVAVVSAAVVLPFVLQLKQFTPWPQVTELWESGLAPLQLWEHPHFYRYCVAYPGLVLESHFLHFGFSGYISVFFAVNCLLLSRISRARSGRFPPLWAWVVFVALHWVMNGRGVLIWCAWLMCMHTWVRADRPFPRFVSELPRVAVSLILSATSTGAFVVVAGAFLLLAARLILKRPEAGRLGRYVFARIGLAVIAAAFGGYLVTAIMKNLDYYGGVLAMLNHGWGTFILRLPASEVLLLLFPVLLVAMGFIAVAAVHALHLRVCRYDTLILLPLVGGIFGYTVLTLTLPSLIVRVVEMRERFRRQNISFRSRWKFAPVRS